jgi:putative transposase
MTELKNRGVADILIAVVDGLKGFPVAITAVFPEARIQTCVVHLIRYSMEFASRKERKRSPRGSRRSTAPAPAEAAQSALEAFDSGPWGRKYPAIAAAWRRNWEQVIPFFAYPPEVRRIINTTNAIESLHSLRCVGRCVPAGTHRPTRQPRS